MGKTWQNPHLRLSSKRNYKSNLIFLCGVEKLMKSQIPQRRTIPWGLLGEFLLLTSALGASAGLGFGAAITLNRPVEPGGTILHSEQSFPPRQDWPIGQSVDTISQR